MSLALATRYAELGPQLARESLGEELTVSRLSGWEQGAPRRNRATPVRGSSTSASRESPTADGTSSLRRQRKDVDTFASAIFAAIEQIRPTPETYLVAIPANPYSTEEVAWVKFSMGSLSVLVDVLVQLKPVTPSDVVFVISAPGVREVIELPDLSMRREHMLGLLPSARRPCNASLLRRAEELRLARG